MTAFEEALVAVITKRVDDALDAFTKHSREQDAGRRSQLLGDAQMAMAMVKDHVRALTQMHEMHAELEREARG